MEGVIMCNWYKSKRGR